jgi:DNA modification methylase
VLVWCKKRENQLGFILSDCELAWMNRGKGCYLFRHVWFGFDRETERNAKVLDATQKPVAVMKWLIQRMKLPRGTVICDPYCGSGTTLQAAAELGFDAIGIEIDPTYYRRAKRRLGL